MAVLIAEGVGPFAKERSYPDFERRAAMLLSRNVGAFAG